MLLKEMKTVRGRWLKIDRDTFSALINFIEQNNVNSEDIGTYLGVGFDKVRSIMDYLIMFGIVKKKDKKDQNIYINDLYFLMKSVFSPREMTEVFFYNYVQNYQLTNWFFLEFCNHRIKNGVREFRIDEVRNSVSDFIKLYKSNTKEDTVLRYIKQDIGTIMNKNSPLSSINILISTSNENLQIRSYTEVSRRVIAALFYISWNTFFDDITNMRIEDIVINKRFPFRTFLIDDESVLLDFFVYMERLKIIKMVDIADIRHITINKTLKFEELIKMFDREELYV